MVSFAKIPDLVGYLVLTEYGAVLESDGDLKNDENCANIVTSIINLADSVDENTLPKSGCQRMSIVFEHHSYTICLSNKKIYVAKRAIRNVNNQQSSPTSQSVTTAPAPAAATTTTTTASASGTVVAQPENKSSNIDLASGQQMAKEHVVHA